MSGITCNRAFACTYEGSAIYKDYIFHLEDMEMQVQVTIVLHPSTVKTGKLERDGSTSKGHRYWRLNIEKENRPLAIVHRGSSTLAGVAEVHLQEAGEAEQVALEQVIASLLAGTAEWVQRHQSDSLVDAMQLAKDHVCICKSPIIPTSESPPTPAPQKNKSQRAGIENKYESQCIT